MLTIDADAHVIRVPRADYLEGTDRRFRPVPVSADMPAGTRQNFWIIDGRLSRRPRHASAPRRPRSPGDDRHRFRRLRHMDEIGTGVQVLYPHRAAAALQAAGRGDGPLPRLQPLARRHLEEGPRMRWARAAPGADAWRRRWELRWASENGACAVSLRGVETHQPLHHPYFFPLYEEAQRLDMAISIHRRGWAASHAGHLRHRRHLSPPPSSPWWGRFTRW